MISDRPSENERGQVNNINKIMIIPTYDNNESYGMIKKY